MPYFKQDDVKITGALKSYEHRSDETHRVLRVEFCPNCGTTVSMTAEVFPGLRGVAGGTFDDRSWIKVDRQVWTRSAHRWVTLPFDIESFPKASVLPPPKSAS